MKIRFWSWVLAAAYFISGLLIARAVSRFAAMYANWDVYRPSVSLAVFAVGALGWLVASLFGALFVVLKDLKFRSTRLNPIFALILIGTVGVVLIALLLPAFADYDFKG